MILNVTKFKIEVWNEIKKIQKGSVKTYKEIALILNKPKSSRAVANACGKNPQKHLLIYFLWRCNKHYLIL